MSQYFSRLAQRSGVSVAAASPTPAAASDGAASDGWSESSSEVVALGAPAATTHWAPGPEDFALPSLTTAAQDTPSASTTTAAGDAASPAIPSTRAAAVPADATAPEAREFLAHVQALGAQWRAMDAMEGHDAGAPARAVTDAPGSATSGNVAPRQRANVRANAAAAPDIGKVPPGADGDDPVITDLDGEAPASVVSHSPPGEAANRELHRLSPMTLPITPAMASPRPATMARIVANSPQSPDLPGRHAPAASAPAVEVHIGRIELEVHAPAAAPATAPATPTAVPLAVLPPAANRETTISLYRHYLRGR